MKEYQEWSYKYVKFDMLIYSPWKTKCWLEREKLTIVCFEEQLYWILSVCSQQGVVDLLKRNDLLRIVKCVSIVVFYFECVESYDWCFVVLTILSIP